MDILPCLIYKDDIMRKQGRYLEEGEMGAHPPKLSKHTLTHRE